MLASSLSFPNDVSVVGFSIEIPCKTISRRYRHRRVNLNEDVAACLCFGLGLPMDKTAPHLRKTPGTIASFALPRFVIASNCSSVWVASAFAWASRPREEGCPRATLETAGTLFCRNHSQRIYLSVVMEVSMYRDFGGSYGRCPSPEPEKRRPQLSKRQQKLLIWAIGLELLLFFLAPVGGTSLVDVLAFIIN